MLPFILILTAGYLVFLICEKRANDRALASFQYVIHVNGIRGKTSVCRLIDAHLRGAGYRVFTKTTGSTPVYIDTGGVSHEIKRRGSVNIHEQLAMIRLAHREKAQILILECMAVQPELQRAAQEQIVKGTLNVITNVRYDHVFEMGESLEEIAESLSNTVPSHGVLFTADERFYPFFQEKCKEKDAQAVLCRGDEWAANENEAIALAVGRHLGVPEESFREHIRGYQEDFGAHKLYHTQKTEFLNLFSVNDPQSTRKVLETYYPDTSGVVFLYHNRTDRPDRLLLFLRYFFPNLKFQKVLVMGEGKGLACRLLKKSGCADVEAVPTWQAALERAGESPLVGIGNIKGQAYDMINYFEGGGSHE